MNVASGSIEIIAMDKTTQIEGLPAEEEASTGSTGGGCVDCETDPAVTSKITTLEQTVADQNEKLHQFEETLNNMKTNPTDATDGAATGGADADPCLHGECEELQPLPETDAGGNVSTGNSSTGSTNSSSGMEKTAGGNSTVLDGLPAEDKECIPATTVKSQNNTVCNIVTITGRQCESDLTYEQGKEACAVQGKSVCTHAQLETAFQCGFKTQVCGWTKSTVKDGGRIVERLLQKELQICELEAKAMNKNNQGEETYGVHCCNVPAVVEKKIKRRFLRRR